MAPAARRSYGERPGHGKRQRIEFVVAANPPPPGSGHDDPEAPAIHKTQEAGPTNEALAARLASPVGPPLQARGAARPGGAREGGRAPAPAGWTAGGVGAMSKRQREQCLDFARQALSGRKPGDTVLLVFNLFALEGFHVAEHLGVPCLAASPYCIPYAPPSGLERALRRRWPGLVEKLQVRTNSTVGLIA
jgi:hypothetical protein